MQSIFTTDHNTTQDMAKTSINKAKTPIKVVMDTPEGEPSETVIKPKKVLTEAQRLAFLKGREKRQANILRKKEEIKEAEEVEPTPEPQPEPDPEPEPDPDTDSEDDDDATEEPEEVDDPPIQPNKRPKKAAPTAIKPQTVNPSHLDPAAIADLVFERMKMLKTPEKQVEIEAADPPKRKYERKPRAPSSSPPRANAPVPGQRIISWM